MKNDEYWEKAAFPKNKRKGAFKHKFHNGEFTKLKRIACNDIAMAGERIWVNDSYLIELFAKFPEIIIPLNV